MRPSADGKTWLSVAAACVRENWIPSYITAHCLPRLQAGGFEKTDDYAYVKVVVADRRAGVHHTSDSE